MNPYPLEASEEETEKTEAAIEIVAELQLTADQLKVIMCPAQNSQRRNIAPALKTYYFAACRWWFRQSLPFGDFKCLSCLHFRAASAKRLAI